MGSPAAAGLEQWHRVVRNMNDETAAAIIATCKQQLANFMVPTNIVWSDSLPKNPNGKVDRKMLVSEYQDMYLETT